MQRYKGQLVAEPELGHFLFISTFKILNIYYYKILAFQISVKPKRVNKHLLSSYTY